MNTVNEFMPKGYTPGADVLVLGMSPSKHSDKPRKNGTCNTLATWMRIVGCHEWDFYNVIPHTVNSTSMSDVDPIELLYTTQNRVKIVALGGFVSRVCNKYNVPHYRIDHPSPRNRNFNDPNYQARMLAGLDRYLWDGRFERRLGPREDLDWEIVDADRPD
jgi:hypothetical protein